MGHNTRNKKNMVFLIILLSICAIRAFEFYRIYSNLVVLPMNSQCGWYPKGLERVIAYGDWALIESSIIFKNYHTADELISIASNEWESKEELISFLCETDDPFSPDSYRLSENADGLFVYSIGNDLIDQGGMIIYDPTNGTRSLGDICVKVSNRKF